MTYPHADVFVPRGTPKVIAEGVHAIPVSSHGKPGVLVVIDGILATLKPTEHEALAAADSQIRRHLGRVAARVVRAQAWGARQALIAACPKHVIVEEPTGRCLRVERCVLCGFEREVDSGD